METEFAAHPDFKIHTGGVMTLVGGAIQYISRGGKLNTLIRTEAKLIGYDYTYNMILWMILLIGYQDCDFDKKIIY